MNERRRRVLIGGAAVVLVLVATGAWLLARGDGDEPSASTTHTVGNTQFDVPAGWVVQNATSSFASVHWLGGSDGASDGDGCGGKADTVFATVEIEGPVRGVATPTSIPVTIDAAHPPVRTGEDWQDCDERFQQLQLLVGSAPVDVEISYGSHVDAAVVRQARAIAESLRPA